MSIIKTPALHTLHYAIVLAYCAADLMFILVYAPSFLLQFIIGYFPAIPCRIASILGILIHFGLIYHLSLIAYERFIYFCKPMIYDQHLTTTRVAVATTVIYLIPSVFVVATDLSLGRKYHPSVMTCNLEPSAFQSIIQFCIFVLLPMIIIIYCFVKIWKLIKAQSVAPVLPSGAQNQQANPPMIQKAKSALRMILLISVTFWCSYIPGIALHGILFQSGYVWADIDTRRHLVPAILMRSSLYLYAPMPMAINPFIYYYTNQELRKAFMKLIRQNNAVAPMP